MKLCACCFQDEEIRQFIESTSKEVAVCDYCGKTSKLIEVEELLDFFSEFISIFHPDTDGIPLVEIIQRDWNIFSNSSLGSTLLSDILANVNSVLFSSDTLVTYLPEITECVNYWDSIKESLKWEQRFLINAAKLEEEYSWSTLFYVNAAIDSSVSLYRARIHHDGRLSCFSTTEMGSPPQNKSTAGRANPLGIPYLYLSKSKETTLYETRALYLDILSIGRFVVSNETLKIVDFTSKSSPFTYEVGMVELAKSFLLKRAISHDLSKPIRRFDSELEYIPTQFLCEFIRYNTGADGIQFSSSVHKGGVNIVLFNPNAVECIDVELHQITGVKITSEVM